MVSEDDSQGVVDNVKQDDLIESIEVHGDVVFDSDVQDAVDNWNIILEKIML